MEPPGRTGRHGPLTTQALVLTKSGEDSLQRIFLIALSRMAGGQVSNSRHIFLHLAESGTF